MYFARQPYYQSVWLKAHFHNISHGEIDLTIIQIISCFSSTLNNDFNFDSRAKFATCNSRRDVICMREMLYWLDIHRLIMIGRVARFPGRTLISAMKEKNSYGKDSIPATLRPFHGNRYIMFRLNCGFKPQLSARQSGRCRVIHF